MPDDKEKTPSRLDGRTLVPIGISTVIVGGTISAIFWLQSQLDAPVADTRELKYELRELRASMDRLTDQLRRDIDVKIDGVNRELLQARREVAQWVLLLRVQNATLNIPEFPLK